MFRKLFGSPTPTSEYYVQALRHYQNLRNYPNNSPQAVNTIYIIIKLCQLAISDNKFDGDAHVLLANGYLLAATLCVYGKGYSFFLARAAAVIQAVKTRNMQINERENADKIYKGVSTMLSAQDKFPEWALVEPLPTNMDLLERAYYQRATDPSYQNEIQEMLKSELKK